MSWSVVLALGAFLGAAIIYSALLTLQAYESRRFVRSRLRRPLPDDLPQWHTLVLVPCKGAEPGLEDNLHGVLRQDWPHYAVRFIVQSPDDPACPVIQRVRKAHPQIQSEIVIAGQADQCGQKVHNLRAATAQLPPETEVLAFLDSDACPSPQWLRAHLMRLARGQAGASTGYRWFVPQRQNLPTRILCSINSAVAGLFGPGGHHLVWGGSWAIRRELFEACGLRDAWQGTLSDDLVASRVLHFAGQQVEFEPRCLVPSPLASDWRRMTEFLRRQYLIGRRYVPLWWSLCLLAACWLQAAFWGGLLTAAIGCWQGWPEWPAALGASGLLYALQWARARLRQDMARIVLPEHFAATAAAARWDCWAGPINGLVNLVCLFSSAVGNRVAWRGIGYHIGPGGRILLLGRRPEPAVLAAMQCNRLPPARLHRQAS